MQEGHRMLLEQHAVQEHKRRQTLAALGDTSALLAGDAYKPLLLLVIPLLPRLPSTLYTLPVAAEASLAANAFVVLPVVVC
eukprot:1998-Heterococcus_DN1.PRE.5